MIIEWFINLLAAPVSWFMQLLDNIWPDVPGILINGPGSFGSFFGSVHTLVNQTSAWLPWAWFAGCATLLLNVYVVILAWPVAMKSMEVASGIFMTARGMPSPEFYARLGKGPMGPFGSV